MYALFMSLVARSTPGPQIFNASLKYGFKRYLLYFASVLYACPKGTIYQDVFIYIKFYISMSRLDYTYQDLHTRKTRFQHTYQDLRTRIKIRLRVHQV